MATAVSFDSTVSTPVTMRDSTTPLSETTSDISIECTSMNDYLWVVRQDWTTLPVVMSIFALLYAVIIVAGVVGNVCVILAIGRQRSLQTVPNMFIFALSCSDVVVSCTSATITPITAFKKEWLFGQFLCSFAPFIAGVSLCVSTFTLAAISIDRFILIRFPMKRPFTHAQAAVVIGLICLLSAGLSMPSMFMQSLRPIGTYCGRFCFEDWGGNVSQRRAYGTLMLTLQFILPLVVIVACYTAISMRLGKSLALRSKKEQRQRQGHVEYEWQAEINDQQRAAIRRRQRTNRMFIAMVVAFSASWIWNIGFNLSRDYDIWPAFLKRQEFFFGIVTHCVAMTSTVWNPLLYAMLNLQLRAAFLQLVPVKELWAQRCCCRRVVGTGGGGGGDGERGETEGATKQSHPAAGVGRNPPATVPLPSRSGSYRTSALSYQSSYRRKILGSQNGDCRLSANVALQQNGALLGLTASEKEDATALTSVATTVDEWARSSSELGMEEGGADEQEPSNAIGGQKYGSFDERPDLAGDPPPLHSSLVPTTSLGGASDILELKLEREDEQLQQTPALEVRFENPTPEEQECVFGRVKINSSPYGPVPSRQQFPADNASGSRHAVVASRTSMAELVGRWWTRRDQHHSADSEKLPTAPSTTERTPFRNKSVCASSVRWGRDARQRSNASACDSMVDWHEERRRRLSEYGLPDFEPPPHALSADDGSGTQMFTGNGGTQLSGTAREREGERRWWRGHKEVFARSAVSGPLQRVHQQLQQRGSGGGAGGEDGAPSSGGGGKPCRLGWKAAGRSRTADHGQGKDDAEAKHRRHSGQQQHQVPPTAVSHQCCPQCDYHATIACEHIPHNNPDIVEDSDMVREDGDQQQLSAVQRGVADEELVASEKRRRWSLSKPKKGKSVLNRQHVN